MMAKIIAIVLVICGIVLFTQDNAILGFIIVALGGVVFSKSGAGNADDEEVWEHDGFGDDGDDSDNVGNGDSEGDGD